MALAMAAAVLAGCSAPIGRDGEPIGLGQAVCEAFPGTRCCRHHPPLPPQPYCTRTLADTDCWVNPAALVNEPPDVADTPPPPPSGCG